MNKPKQQRTQEKMMKALLALMILSLSVNVMAHDDRRYDRYERNHPQRHTHADDDDVLASLLTIATLFTTTETDTIIVVNKIAQQVQNDSQAYFQTGAMSPLLERQVGALLAQDAKLSVDEAMTSLLDFAEKNL